MTRLRWYLMVGVTIAIAGYALGARGWALPVIAVGAPALLIASMHFLQGAARGALTRSAREDADGRAATMSGTEFEDYVAGVART